LQVGRRVLDSFLPSSMLLAITAKTLSSSSRSCSHACTCSVCFFRSGMNFRPGAEVLYRGQRTGMLRPKRPAAASTVHSNSDTRCFFIRQENAGWFPAPLLQI
jgi:hypothetical protein